MRALPAIGRLCIVALLLSCAREPAGDAPVTASSVTLAGAGATFPYPIYTRWFTHFAETGGARITYQSVGSGAGIRALLADSLDFAATDVPLTSAERSALSSRGIRQVPMVVGGAAVTYHVPSLPRQLRLDGVTLGDIFLGRITTWNDARLVALNPDIELPAEAIRVITRADSSGTSWILTDYLARQHPAWASGPGRSRFPRWPVGSGVRGNEGVASEVKVTAYAIGVVEAVYAMQNRLPVARIRNHAGAWVTPQTGALRAAADAMLESIDDTVEFATSISDAPGEHSYPLASLSWLLVPSRGRDSARVSATGDFVRWALEHGQDDALALGYAPLPDAMRTTLLRAWSVPRR
ncbi:MAG: phosphate ABC transporter substrate-binding protein PstS [Gemmatimonadota bacterium]